MPSSEPVPSLRELQRGLAARLAPWGIEGAVAVESWLADPPRGELAERLAVYRDGYSARMREALADVYPAVEHLLGAGGFTALTRRYLVATRPAAANLNHVGRDLPGYLERDEAARELPFLPDLARLERAAAWAFHARQARPFDPRALAGVPAEHWDRMAVRFQSAVAVVTSPWPILDLMRTVDTPRDRIDLVVDGRPQRVLVFRRELEVRCETIEAPCARALTILLRGRPLGAVSAALAGAGVEAAMVRAWFQDWMAAGLIVAVEDGASASAG